MDQFSLPKINQNASLSNMNNTAPVEFTQNASTMNKKFVQTKVFNKDDGKIKKNYDMKLKKSQIDQNQPVYIYAGQKNNWYEKQMK